MGKALVNESSLAGIGDAIREKLGVQTTYKPSEMAEAIEGISGGGGYDFVFGVGQPSSDEFSDGQIYVELALITTSTNKPSTITDPVSAFAGQRSDIAYKAFMGDTTDFWTTNDHNYQNLWIAGDYGEPVVKNMLSVKPRTYNNARQINNIYVEASNDQTDWTLLYEGEEGCRGNALERDAWTSLEFNNSDAYRYYRLRTDTGSDGKINGSVTFTLYGVGFWHRPASQPNIESAKKLFVKINNTIYPEE